MKRNGICPKCDGRQFWRIETQVPVASRDTPAVVWMKAVDPRIGSYESISCAACGFTEWYAVGIENLQPDPTRGVYFVDNEPKTGLR